MQHIEVIKVFKVESVIPKKNSWRLASQQM